MTAAAGQAQANPVGRPITAPAEARRIDEGFQQMNRMGIERLPILGDPPRHPPQEVTGQRPHLHPRQNQETGVVGDQVQVAPAHFNRPADEAVPRGQVPWSRRPGQRREGIGSGEHQVFQMFSDRLGVTQVVVDFHQLAKERFFGRAPHLPDLQRTQFAQAACPGPFPQGQSRRGGRTGPHVVGR